MSDIACRAVLYVITCVAGLCLWGFALYDGWQTAPMLSLPIGQYIVIGLGSVSFVMALTVSAAAVFRDR